MKSYIIAPKDSIYQIVNLLYIIIEKKARISLKETIKIIKNIHFILSKNQAFNYKKRKFFLFFFKISKFNTKTILNYA